MLKRRKQLFGVLLATWCRPVKCTAMLNKIKFLNFKLESFVKVFDVLFSLIVVGPLVIIYWISIWKIFDFYITPGDQKLSAVISFVIGLSGQFVLTFFQDEIAKILKFKKRKFLNLIVSKVYSLFFAATLISLWRGVWKFADFTSPDESFTTFFNIAQNSVIMMISKTLKNSISSPFVVATDQIENDYKIPTYFTKVVN